MKGIAVFDFNPGEEALLLSSRGWDLGFADPPVEEAVSSEPVSEVRKIPC